jgi:hypothetical protein
MDVLIVVAPDMQKDYLLINARMKPSNNMASYLRESLSLLVLMTTPAADWLRN